MNPEWIDRLGAVLERWLSKRVGEEKARRFSRPIAAVLIAAAEYGAGNALGGFLLLKHSDAVDRVIEILTREVGCDIRVWPTLPPQYRALFLVDEIKPCIDDEEARNAIEELERYAMLGRYIPSWAKTRDL